MKVSVIIPCYNEEEVLPLSHKRFSQVMGSTAHDYELIFVNDILRLRRASSNTRDCAFVR